MNDLTERYLQAIAFWLPKRDDIVAEISEDFYSQIADEEEKLGRSLTDGETEALLKRRGRPVIVANGYRTQRSLIGPTWFPIYVLVLKAAMVCGVLPWIVVWFIVAREQHPGASWARSLFAAWGTFCSLTFFIAGVVTLLFAVLQWAEARTHFLDQWSPRQLPPVRDPGEISLSSAVTALTANVVFLLLWLVYARSPVVFDAPTFKLVLTPTWTLFFWGFVAVTLCNVALTAAHLRSRYWTRFRAAARMLLDLTSGALFCCLMKAHLVATLSSAGLGDERSLALKGAIHLWMDRCFPFALAIAAVALIGDAMRLARVSQKKSLTPARALALLIAALLFTTAAHGQQVSASPVAASSVSGGVKIDHGTTRERRFVAEQIRRSAEFSQTFQSSCVCDTPERCTRWS